MLSRALFRGSLTGAAAAWAYTVGTSDLASAQSDMSATAALQLNDGNMWGHGTHFDITNTSGSEVHITAFAAGSGESAGTTQAALYVCTDGASICKERDPSAWKRVWSGSLHEETFTKYTLDAPVAIAASSTTGFCLHSNTHGRAVALSDPCSCASDTNLLITPGYATGNRRSISNSSTPTYHHCLCQKYREFGEAVRKKELSDRSNHRVCYRDNPYKFTPAGFIEYRLQAGKS